MTSIVIYADDADTNQNVRIDGMSEAGDAVRNGTPNVQNQSDAENLVKGIVSFAVSDSDMHARLHTSNGDFVILPLQGDNYELNGTNKKLKLNGAIDAKNGNVINMTSVIPKGTNPATGWTYITDTIVPDILKLYDDYVNAPNSDKPALEEKIENYMIATLTFTRCR